ncbi:hypothetical protein LTR08_007762 [Meristemomyces frigidus]|nr:hypothetical protein LTR08_007762 [Meristemomyces frigidus]
MVRTPGGRLKILDIERSLGVWWPLGFSRHKDRLKIPIVKRLEDGVKRITPVFGAKNQTEIRASEELRVEAERLFADVGPELWPDAQHDRSEWLVDAATNNLAGQYPSNLYYSNDADRARLWDLFYLLIIAKTIRYYENHGRGWHYETVETQSNERTEHDGGGNGLPDHLSDDADDSDYETRSPSNDLVPRPSSQRRQQPRHSPSGFTPVNGASLQYQTNSGDASNRPFEQPPATSIGGFRTAQPAASGQKLPSPGTNKRPESEDAELPESKRAKQQSTVRDPTSATEPNNISIERDRPLSNKDAIGTDPYSHNGTSETPHTLDPPAPNATHSPSVLAQDASLKLESMSAPQSGSAKETTPASTSRAIFADGPDAAKPSDIDELHLDTAGSSTRTGSEMSHQTENVPSQPMQASAFPSGHSLAGKGGRSHRAKYRAIAHAAPGAAEPSDVAGKRKTSTGRQHPPSQLLNGASAREVIAPQYLPTMASYSSPYEHAVSNAALDNPSATYYAPLGPTQAPIVPARHAANVVVPRFNNDEVFAVTEVEIDWWADGQVQGFMQLDANDNVDTFFGKLDDEMPPTLKDRAVRAVRIEHLNPEPQSGKPFNARIRRGGFAGFKALIRRIQQQRVGAVPELMVTVEWET